MKLFIALGAAVAGYAAVAQFNTRLRRSGRGFRGFRGIVAILTRRASLRG